GDRVDGALEPLDDFAERPTVAGLGTLQEFIESDVDHGHGYALLVPKPSIVALGGSGECEDQGTAAERWISVASRSAARGSFLRGRHALAWPERGGTRWFTYEFSRICRDLRASASNPMSTTWPKRTRTRSPVESSTVRLLAPSDGGPTGP